MLKLRLLRHFNDLSLSFNYDNLLFSGTFVFWELDGNNSAIKLETQVPDLFDINVKLSKGWLLLHGEWLVFICLRDFLLLILGPFLLKLEELELILTGYLFISLAALQAQLDINRANMCGVGLSSFQASRNLSRSRGNRLLGILAPLELFLWVLLTNGRL